MWQKFGRSRALNRGLWSKLLQAYELRGAGAVLHSHSLNAFLATLLDPEARELRLTHMEMIKGIAGQAREAALAAKFCHGMEAAGTFCQLHQRMSR